MNYDWLENATQKELTQFKSVCNQLLSKTFVVRSVYVPEKGPTNNPDYSFLSIHFEEVRDYLFLLDWDLRKDDFNGYFYIWNTDEANRCNLNKNTTAILLTLRMAPELMEGEGGLFAIPFQSKYGKLIEDLFSRISTADDTQLNARKQSELQQNIERYTDFRTYLKFDLETTDQNGSKQLLSQTLNTKSGGETQTPFYIAVLASFAQLYQVNNHSGLANNTVRLVVFDEAFNKMDSDRIIESIHLLRQMHLQAIICTPPDKLPDIMVTDNTFD